VSDELIWSPASGDYDESCLYRVGRHSDDTRYLKSNLATVYRNTQTVHPSWEVALCLPHRKRVEQTFLSAEDAKAYAVAVWRLDYGT
jgi:hypothetical protein